MNDEMIDLLEQEEPEDPRSRYRSAGLIALLSAILLACILLNLYLWNDIQQSRAQHVIVPSYTARPVEQPSTPSNTPRPTRAPSQTASPIPTQEASATPEPTATHPPTETPRPTSTPTPTKTPTPTPSPTPTDDPAISVLIEPVWYCRELDGGKFEWYEVERTFLDGVAIAEQVKSGPHTGPWQPGCPPAAQPGKTCQLSGSYCASLGKLFDVFACRCY